MTAIYLETSGISEIVITQDSDNQVINDRVQKVFVASMGLLAATWTTAILFAKTGLAECVDRVISNDISNLLYLGAFAISSLAATILTPSKYSLLKFGCYSSFLISKALMISTQIKGVSGFFAIRAATSFALAAGFGTGVMHLQKKSVNPINPVMFGSLLAIFGLDKISKGLSALLYPSAMVCTNLCIAKKQAVNSDFDLIDASMKMDLEYFLLKGIINRCNDIWNCVREKWQGPFSPEENIILTE